jgi:hypothetical protein
MQQHVLRIVKHLGRTWDYCLRGRMTTGTPVVRSEKEYMEKSVLPKVFVYQSVGFLAIIALSWLDEELDLTRFVFGDLSTFPKFQASILEMLFALMVWLLVAGATRRLLERVRYLEGFMRVCAWCRRIDYGGQWVPLEEFLKRGFDTPTTHGICEECLAREKAAAERACRSKTHSAPSCG